MATMTPANSVNIPARTGELIREPTVPEKIANTYGYLAEAHTILDRLEGMEQGLVQPMPESLVGMTAALSELAASLNSRLLTLFGER